MNGDPGSARLADFARAGFHDLSSARDNIARVTELTAAPQSMLLAAFSSAAHPDTALARVLTMAESSACEGMNLDEGMWQNLCLLIGASPALGDFFSRNPTRLASILSTGGRALEWSEYTCELLESVGASDPGAVEPGASEPGVSDLGTRDLGAPPRHTSQPIAGLTGEQASNALRVRYRELLAELMLLDLRESAQGRGQLIIDEVTRALSDLASAALEAGLAVARADALAGVNGAPVDRQRLEATRLAIIAMGKCGARELNVVSDVDVLFVAEPQELAGTAIITADEAVQIATRLATEMMRVIQGMALEPPLWEVDANLRPEGRQGALVRTLGSMLSYYDRWAKAWEFQALLKARAVAGDRELGEEFVAGTRDMVWASSGREDFVGKVQRMREQVTEHIDDGDLETQIKLGPGGLRDIEFSVQLLQLVHGSYDERLRLRGTLEALAALVAGGYIARGDGERLAADYRLLRTIEHRLQLRDLRRTARMPQDDDGLRALARATGLAPNGSGLLALWKNVKREVRELHLKIFYAPLLSAVAALPDDQHLLRSKDASARLQSIGFLDPEGALRHLSALTRGTSRSALIQRNILPVLLQWLADGTDPDYGLVAFRRVSEANRDTPWYLRLLRDGTEVAERLMRVLSTSKFASELLETVPEAVAWLENDRRLRPVSLTQLLDEMRAVASRRQNLQHVAEALRGIHRREVLRLALGYLVSVNDDADVAQGLDAAHTALLDGLLLALRAAEDRSESGPYELSLVGMGRYGGRELGFAGDIDVMAVTRAPDEATSEQTLETTRAAKALISGLRGFVSDPLFTVDLDFDLRPEGKQGAMVRSLESYQQYYQRWSLTWEAQALLRARHVAGDASLGEAFREMADQVRYPAEFGERELREVRSLKARVEAERLPRGVDPQRHLKLGPGGISDVEWLVQLLQLQYGAHHQALRTNSTLHALSGAVEAGVLDEQSKQHLEAAWRLASSIRTALKLWGSRVTDVLPAARTELVGVVGIMRERFESTTELEEQWLAVARRSRQVFETHFFGYSDRPQTYPLILPT